MGDEGAERVKATYGDNYERLVQSKINTILRISLE